MEKLKNEELDRKSVKEFKQSEKIPVCVVLDNVRSALNVGSVFRSADAFLVEKIYLCGITASPPNKEIRKTALGSTESVDWEYFKSASELIEKLKKDNYKIFSVEQVRGSISLSDFVLSDNTKIAIVFGHEVNGVSQEFIDASEQCIEIPQIGTKHSLNVSVAAGIVLWDIFRRIETD